MRRLIILTAFVGLALVPTMASAQTTPPPTGRQVTEIRKRAENKAVLDVVGAKLRARGLTGAQQAVQARADAEAKRRAKYRKNHRSAIVAKEHPAVKPESKPPEKADPKKSATDKP
jgi:hypothetical protein